MDAKTKTEDGEKGYDFSRAISSHKRFKFGARDSNAITVDVSLANLFQRLTVECSGILGNPQWKHFRHMELLKTEQIRLSNGIWRSWHMQYQRGVKPRFCTFEIDPKRDAILHSQPQAIVIEGKYWRRTDQAVAMEYRKWRIYAKQKAKWSEIRRIPNVATSQPSKLVEPQPMQAETSDFKLNQIFQAIEDFPESLLMDVSRPGDDRLYMRPLVESAEIIQQPYLGMLNPQIDEMVFEPMEVMFPSLGNIPGRFSGNYSTPGAASFNSQQPGLDGSSSRMGGNNPQSYSSPGGLQYENQSTPYINIPPRNIPGYGNQHSSAMPYGGVDPSGGYLNMPMDPRIRSQQPDVMDIGTPPIDSVLKTNAAPKMYRSGQTTPTTPYPPPPSQQPFLPDTNDTSQDKITSLLTQFMHEENIIPSSKQSNPATPVPPQYGGYPPPSQQPSMQPSLPTLPEQQFTEATSSLTPQQSMSRFEHGDQEMQLLAQMKQLEEEHQDKIKELEHQQQIASQQYLTLLQEYVSKSASAQRPSQQQHQVLMSVLSDPTSLNILKAILKDDSSSTLVDTSATVTPKDTASGPITPQTTSPHCQVKKEHGSAQQSPPLTGIGGGAFTTPPQFPPNSAPLIFSPLSTTESSTSGMETSAVSDFQTRLIMAAAAQATMESPSTLQQTALFLPSPVQPKESNSGNTSSNTSLVDSATDLPPASPALMKKFKNARNLTPEEKKVYQELRRQSHITAEQRRRGSIKSGFDHLQSLVINPASFPSGKISKATILEKTIEHIQSHHHEREGRERKIRRLKEEMKELNDAIVLCQEKLPATGAPVTRQRFEENRQMFREYIRHGTQHNYKFWIYSIIIQQLFDSYNSMVSTTSIDELRQTVLSWFEQSCGLPSLRPIVMSSLRELSMKTSILSDSATLPIDQLNESTDTPTQSCTS